MFCISCFVVVLLTAAFLAGIPGANSRPHAADTLGDTAALFAGNRSVSEDSLWLNTRLSRRDNGPPLCRALCSPDTVADVLRRRARRQIPNGLKKRTLQWPIALSDLDEYYIDEFEKDTTYQVLTPLVDDGSSSIFVRILPGVAAFQVGVQGLCGCTTLVIISETAVYMAHLFENQGMRPQSGDETTDRQLFDEYVGDFLDNGRAPGGVGLVDVQDSFAGSSATVIIIAPQNEDDTLPDPYVAGMLYATQIGWLRDKVASILPGAKIQPDRSYQSIDGSEDSPDAYLLDDTSAGRVLFQYDPAGDSQNSGIPVCRLLHEKQMLFRATWGAPPPQQNRVMARQASPFEAAELALFNGSTYTLGAQSNTATASVSKTVFAESSALVVGGQTITAPALSGSAVVVTQAGYTVTFEPAPSPTMTEVLISQSTYALGPTPSTVVVNSVTIVLQPAGVVIANQTLTLAASQATRIVTASGITLTMEAVPASAATWTSSNPASSTASLSSVAMTTTIQPQTSAARTTSTATWSSASSIASQAASAQSWSESSSVSVSTAAAQSPSSPGLDATSSSSPPTPGGASAPPTPTSTWTASASTLLTSTTPNPFPSSIFSLPPLVTTTEVITGPGGPTTTVVTGTTNSGGAIVPIATMGSAEAAASASALATELQAVSSSVAAYATQTSAPGLAAAVLGAVEQAEQDVGEFGTALGTAAAGLCFAYCSTAAEAAAALGSLDTAIAGIAAGTGAVGGLAALLWELSGAAGSLAALAAVGGGGGNGDHGSTQQGSSTSETSAQCSTMTVTDWEVFCGTGVLEDSIASTSCYTTSSVLTACSATPTTTTTYSAAFCIYPRPSAGEAAWVGTDNSYTATTTWTMATAVSAPLPTSSSSISSTITTTTTTTTTTSPSTTSTTITTSTTTTSQLPACPTPPQSCDANGCAGQFNLNDGVAYCTNAFAGCPCTPTANTCGTAQSCDNNGCNGAFDGLVPYPTCQAFFQGCACVATPNTCGSPQSCDSNGCAGAFDGNVVQPTCQGNFVGCPCEPTQNTCGPQQSCDNNGCNGGFSGNVPQATCQGNFAGCACEATANTCGSPQSCDSNGCAGAFDGNVAQPTCQGNFVGCPCEPTANTCGSPQSCDNNGCNGAFWGDVASPQCTGNFVGCVCTATANTCGSPQSCDDNGCAGAFDEGWVYPTCRGNFAGCQCQATDQTCGGAQPCQNGGCAGVMDPDGNARCSGNYWSCPCILESGSEPSGQSPAPPPPPAAPSPPPPPPPPSLPPLENPWYCLGINSEYDCANLANVDFGSDCVTQWWPAVKNMDSGALYDGDLYNYNPPINALCGAVIGGATVVCNGDITQQCSGYDIAFYNSRTCRTYCPSAGDDEYCAYEDSTTFGAILYSNLICDRWW